MNGLNTTGGEPQHYTFAILQLESRRWEQTQDVFLLVYFSVVLLLRSIAIPYPTVLTSARHKFGRLPLLQRCLTPASTFRLTSVHGKLHNFLNRKVSMCAFRLPLAAVCHKPIAGQNTAKIPRVITMSRLHDEKTEVVATDGGM